MLQKTHRNNYLIYIFLFVLTTLPIVHASMVNKVDVAWRVNNPNNVHIGELLDCDIVINNNYQQRIMVTSILYHYPWMDDNSFLIETYNKELIIGENKINFNVEVSSKAEIGASNDYGCFVKFSLENGTLFDSSLIRPTTIVIEKGMSIYEQQTIDDSFIMILTFFFCVILFVIVLFRHHINVFFEKHKKYIPLFVFVFVFVVYVGVVNVNFHTYGVSQPFLQGFSLTGDEPHYIVATEALLKGTLNVSQIYPNGYVQHSRESTGFLLNGTQITTHSLGVPILSIIPYVLGNLLIGSGVYGVLLMSCMFTAGVAVYIYKLGIFLIGDIPVSLLTAISFAFSTLLFSWSGQVFGAPILAFFITFSVYKVLTAQTSIDWIISAIGLTLLTFLKRNMIFLSMVAIGVIFIYLYKNRQTHHLKHFFVAVLICLIPVFIYELGIIGLGTIPFVGNSDVMSIPETYSVFGVNISTHFWLGLLGHWIDANSGVLWYSPIIFFAFLGMVKTVKNNQKFVWMFPLVLFLFWYISTGIVGYWHGWLSPPGRYMIPILPLLSIPMLYAIKDFRLNKKFLLLFSTLFIVGFIINFLIATNRVLGYVVIWVNGVPRNWFWLALGNAFNFSSLSLPDFAYAWLDGGEIGNIPQSTYSLIIWSSLFIVLIVSLIGFDIIKNKTSLKLGSYKKNELLKTDS